MSFRMNAVLPALSALLVPCAAALAAPEPKPAPKPVQPLLDISLRDASICRGGGGEFYMVGIEGPDFDNAARVRLWKSADLKQWEMAGVVWELPKDGRKARASDWMLYHRIPAGGGAPRYGVQSPEIHFLKGTYWIALSVRGDGTALLKSASGKAEGPYEYAGRITTRGGDLSLFAGDGKEGAVYAVFGEGWIARLKEDMSGLAERPRLLQPEPESSLGDFPQTVGSRGAFLFQDGGKYHLVATDITARLGARCEDVFVAEADSVYGPYGPRRLMITHGGQTTVFRDGAGKLWATFGGDDAAVFRDKPAIVPLYRDGFLKHIRKEAAVVTEGGPVAVLEPVPGIDGIRDPHILLAPDGNYYLTGTTSKKELRVPGCRVWRSPDLKAWTALGDGKGVVWYVDQTEWTSKPFRSDAVPQPVHDFWAPQIHFVKGTFWIPFCMFGGGSGLLKSGTGKPEGPYESVGRFDTWGGDPGLFEDGDGTVYYYMGFGPNRLGRMKKDMTGIDGGWKEIGPAGGGRMGYEGPYLARMKGKYVLFNTDWNGEDSKVEKKEAYHKIGTYDFMYCVADRIEGPYSAPRVAVPHGGHGCVFQDKAGGWWAAMFGTDSTAPFRSKLGLLRLRVEEREGGLVIAPEGAP